MPLTLSSNTVNNNDWDGIELADSSHNTIIGNVITDNEKIGLKLSGTANWWNIITNNFVEGNYEGNYEGMVEAVILQVRFSLVRAFIYAFLIAILVGLSVFILSFLRRQSRRRSHRATADDLIQVFEGLHCS